MLLLLGSFCAAFFITGMICQLFPDGRFPLTTILLVIALSTLAAYSAHTYMGNSSIFTGAFIGAGVSSSVLFLLFDRTGVLAQEPWPEEEQGQGH